jgi:hypothetical protein
MKERVMLTDEMWDRLCAMVSVGCSVRRAAKLCGCTEAAVRYREKTDPDFQRRMLESKQIREVSPLRQIREAGTKSWRAAAWLLERVDPQEYGDRRLPPTPDVFMSEALERWDDLERERDASRSFAEWESDSDSKSIRKAASRATCKTKQEVETTRSAEAADEAGEST